MDVVYCTCGGARVMIDAATIRRIGINIQYLRITKTLSQDDLAHLAGVSLSTLRKREEGEGKPQYRTIKKIAKALDVEPEQLASWQCSATNLNCKAEDENFSQSVDNGYALQFLQTDKTLSSQLTKDDLNELAALIARNLLMMNRREMMQGVIATTLASAGTPEVANSIQYGLNGGKVGSEVADWARDQIARLSQLDDLIGGQQLYGIAQSNLNLLQNLLHKRAVSGRDEQELRLAVAHTASQAGWLAQDGELHELAAHHFRFGVEMARSVGDRDFAAYCIMRLASQALALEKPDQCLSQLEVAASEAGEGSALQSLIWNFVVEAQGLLGNHKAASLSLAKADAAFEKRNTDRVPKWLYWLRRPSLTGKTPRAFLSFDPKFAVRLSEDGLRATTSRFARDRLTLLVELAKAKLALRETDEAIARADEVLQVVTHTSIPRVEKQLILFNEQLPKDRVSRIFMQRFAEYQNSRNVMH